MPVGIIINCASVVFGGFLGMLFKKVFPENLKNSLLLYFGFGAMAIGIYSIIKMDSLPVVVLSIIIGSLVGELLKIDDNIKKIISKFLHKKNLSHIKDNGELEKRNKIAMVIAIFCFSGTGIFGALHEGMVGDNSILLAKSALDFFTAIIFASSIGIVISLIAIPQLFIFLILFFLGSLIGPHLPEETIANFVSVGGIITFMLGISIAKIKEIKILNCIPAFVVVIVLSLFFY